MHRRPSDAGRSKNTYYLLAFYEIKVRCIPKPNARVNGHNYSRPGTNPSVFRAAPRTSRTIISQLKRHIQFLKILCFEYGVRVYIE